jgi:hypothetical protein
VRQQNFIGKIENLSNKAKKLHDVSLSLSPIDNSRNIFVRNVPAKLAMATHSQGTATCITLKKLEQQ